MAIVAINSPDKDVQDLLALNFSTGLLMNAVIRKSPQDVFELIQKLDSVDLVVIDAREEISPFIESIHHYIKDNKLPTRLAVIGPAVGLEGTLHSNDVADWRKLILKFLQDSGITMEKIREREVFPYMPIPSRMFRYIKRLPGDVFIQLKASAQNIRYVKRFNKGETISPLDYQHLLAKIDNFYVETEFRSIFVKEISDTLMNEVNKSNLSKVEIFEHQFTMIKMLSHELGFTPEVAKITEECLDEMFNIARSEPRLKTFIEEIYQNNSTGFQSRVVQLTSVLCSSLIQFLKLKDPDAQIKKLSFVAIFHDFLLEEHLLHIRTLKQVEAKDVPEESQRLVLNHAKAAYLYFLNFPEIDVEALEILRQHHGSKHGVGFPVSPDLGLHPLSYIFMICEELAYQLIQTGDLKNLPKILDQMYDRMRTPDNAKYLKAMKEISQISLLN